MSSNLVAFLENWSRRGKKTGLLYVWPKLICLKTVVNFNFFWGQNLGARKQKRINKNELKLKKVDETKSKKSEKDIVPFFFFFVFSDFSPYN